MSSSSGPNSDASSQFEIPGRLSAKIDIDGDKISAKGENQSLNDEDDLN